MSPDEVEKYLFVEGRFRELFGLWGYREVRTSTVDYFDIIRGGAGEGFADSLFKVQDTDGKLLSIRGEVTTQVARMLASKAKYEGRISYVTNCLRFLEMKPFSQREFWQAGAELVGKREVEADAEIIALTLASLDALGLQEATVDVGNLELFRKISAMFGIREIESLRRVMVSKSPEDLRAQVKDQEALKVFSFMMGSRGGPEVIHGLLAMLPALENFQIYFDELYRLLEAYGCASRVSVDLTTLRGMKYYNGTVFDVSLGGLGVPIGGGGRYDAMMEEFGLGGAKATGFAVSIDHCVKALGRTGSAAVTSRGVVKIFYREGYAANAIAFASELRQKGVPCTLDAYLGEVDGILVGNDAIELRTGRKCNL